MIVHRRRPSRNPTLSRPRLFLKVPASLLALGLASAFAQTPELTTDHFTCLPGEPITASFRGGPANPKDWVGVYPDGTEPGSVASTVWLYTDGTTSGT
jgi:hypothetical protein